MFPLPVIGRILTAALLVAPALFAAGEEREAAPALGVSGDLKLTGFVQASYTWVDEAADTFTIRRVRLSLAGDIAPKIKIKFQADLLKTPVLLDAMADVLLSPAAGLRLGQFYVPFGLETRTSTADIETVFRSQISEKLAPGRDIGASGRDIGAQIFGKISVFEYTAGVFNGAGINKLDNNAKKDVGLRFSILPAPGLTLGGSFYDGRTSAASGSPAYVRRRSGLDGILTAGRLIIRTEWVRGRDDLIEKDGWYVQGAYGAVSKKLQAVVKWDSYDPDRAARDDRTRILTVGLNWWLSERTRFLANALWSKRQGAETTARSLILQIQAGF